jgi:serine/threonine protein kinase
MRLANPLPLLLAPMLSTAPEANHTRKPMGKYSILSRIARGGFGVVYEAIDNEASKPVALKLPHTDSDPLELEAEYSYQKVANHPNIAKVYKLETFSTFLLAMELANGGTLTKQLHTRGTVFSELEARDLFCQLVEAVAHLHSIGMAHRDIKPDNVLFFDNTPKLVDFGLSCWSDGRDPLDRRNKRVGTKEYAAPELFDDTVVISDPRPADIYSLGQLFSELVLGGTFEEVGDDVGYLSPLADDLLAAMLEPDPLKRISADEVLKHPWFAMDHVYVEAIDDDDEANKGFLVDFDWTLPRYNLLWRSESSPV